MQVSRLWCEQSTEDVGDDSEAELDKTSLG